MSSWKNFRRSFLMAVSFAGLLAGCYEPRFQTTAGETMGTYYRVTFKEDAACTSGLAFDRRLAAINASMSTYIPDSELMQINLGPAGKAWPLSPDLDRVFATAQRIHGETGGALDVTVGPLIELWGFGASDFDGTAPNPDRLEVAAAAVGMTHIDYEQGFLEKKREATRIDLSAVAKGYAVDALSELLDAAGCRDYMVDIGGEIRVRGQNPRGRPWAIGIEVPDPTQLGGTHRVIVLEDAAVATSGDYRNYRVIDGRQVHHVFDPRTHAPAEHSVVSATVVARQAMDADGYATGLMVMGADEGIRLADELGLPALLLSRDESGALVEHVSRAMTPYLD